MKKGLLIVYTGNGKGKTTAALGMMFRAWGRGMRVGMFQFLKSGTADYGEYRAAKKLGIEIESLGDGCSWESKDWEISREVNLAAWEKVKEKITSGGYDVLVLDEFTFLFHFKWLDPAETVRWILQNKPPSLHLVITGRDAPAEFLDMADLVTEALEIKHPYQQGVLAQAGIEF
ncbi:cob(I)yrinic acid a,c-diamide adenosyltransferase [Chloroflexi bacterium CFX5]|nr:cob(I)yrinic acid a,c-diamide adenosyltransferase [Chloroflexota bacterium]MDL1918130.1 cob(I)yrinic acid a,c-diamide adenosyltransferase [Chloroflexi bacterium CFX5]